MANFQQRGAAQCHVLTDGGDGIGDRGIDGDVANFGGLDLLDVAADLEGDLRDHLDQSLELLVARDESRFRN